MELKYRDENKKIRDEMKYKNRFAPQNSLKF